MDIPGLLAPYLMLSDIHAKIAYEKHILHSCKILSFFWEGCPLDTVQFPCLFVHICWLSKSLHCFHCVCILRSPNNLGFWHLAANGFIVLNWPSLLLHWTFVNPYFASGTFFRGLHSSYSSQVQMCNVPSCYDVPRWTRRQDRDPGWPHMGSCGQGAVHMEQAAKQGSMGALGRETISHLSRSDHTRSDTCWSDSVNLLFPSLAYNQQ